MIRRNLLDLSVLIALTTEEHRHHQFARDWFTSSGKDNWGICPLTEVGFIRVTANPVMQAGQHSLEQSIAILQALKSHPGYRYWPITESWENLTSPFAKRISGYQQGTDAYLLGLAVRENAVLVTFDRAVRHLAGVEYERHVLLLG